MSACACIGPAGNCQCLKAARGEKVPLMEIQVSPDLFSLLPFEDQETINRLKLKALALSFGHTPEEPR